MAATNVEICNLALDNLGVTNKIVALTDTTKEGKACKRWYLHAGQICLRQFPWPFASLSVALVASTGKTHPEWPYVFDLPTNFLKLRRLFSEGAARNVVALKGGLVVPVEDVATMTTKIGCDAADPYAQYTVGMVSDSVDTYVPRYSADFVDAFAAKLAQKLVTPLSLEKSLINQMGELYANLVGAAYASASEEMTRDEQPEASWIDVR